MSSPEPNELTVSGDELDLLINEPVKLVEVYIWVSCNIPPWVCYVPRQHAHKFYRYFFRH